MPTPTHSIPPTHPSLACQPNYLWACLLMLGKSCSTPSSEIPSPSPSVYTVPHSQWSKQPPHSTDPSTKTHLCLTQTKHIHIYSLKTHTHKFSSLCRSLKHKAGSECQCFFPCCYELNKKAQWSWASWCCEVWAEPWTYWPIPFNPLFVEPPIYLVSLLLPLCQLQLFWVWKHIQKWLQH